MICLVVFLLKKLFASLQMAFIIVTELTGENNITG